MPRRKHCATLFENQIRVHACANGTRQNRHPPLPVVSPSLLLLRRTTHLHVGLPSISRRLLLLRVCSRSLSLGFPALSPSTRPVASPSPTFTCRSTTRAILFFSAPSPPTASLPPPTSNHPFAPNHSRRTRRLRPSFNFATASLPLLPLSSTIIIPFADAVFATVLRTSCRPVLAKTASRPRPRCHVPPRQSVALGPARRCPHHPFLLDVVTVFIRYPTIRDSDPSAPWSGRSLSKVPTRQIPIP